MRKWMALCFAMLLVCSMAAGPASANPQPQMIIVALASNRITDADRSAITAAGGAVVGEIPEIGVLQVSAASPGSFYKAVAGDPRVAGAGPDIMVQLNLPASGQSEPADFASPVPRSDPAAYTWGIDQVTENGRAWAIHQGTKDVVVGIIDSGLDFSHPDLRDNIVPGSRTFNPNTSDAWDQMGHGTHVAGTIAANGRIRGVAPGVGIRAYRVFGPDGGASIFWVAQAIAAAADDGVDVINMSLGSMFVRGQWYYTDPGSGERIRLGGDGIFIAAVKRAVQYAVRRNVTVVAAAGNDSQDVAKRNGLVNWLNAYLQSLGLGMYSVQGAAFESPGGLPGAITVSATGGGWGSPDRLAFYSNYGTGFIDVAGPGGDLGPSDAPLDPDSYKFLILSTVPTYMPCSISMTLFGACGYGFSGGTSMAAPHVTGAAALYISAEYARTGKKPTPAQVTAQLVKSAQDLGKPGYDALYGKGLVNANRALTAK